MVVHVLYYLSPSGQKEALRRNLPAREKQEAFIDDPENRLLERVSVQSDGSPLIDLQKPTLRLKHTDVSMAGEPSRKVYLPETTSAGDRFTVDAPLTTLEEAAAAIARFDAMPAECLAQLPQLQAEEDKAFAVRKTEYQQRQEADRRKREQQEANESAERARLQAEVKAREDERRTWVEAHGSAYLKKAVAAGYDCQRLYVTERAAMEYPGFYVDFSDNWEEKSRSCPSEEMLEKALSVGGTVIWLLDPGTSVCEQAGIDTDFDAPRFEPREAVAVYKFLGKYDIMWFEAD